MSNSCLLSLRTHALTMSRLSSVTVIRNALHRGGCMYSLGACKTYSSVGHQKEMEDTIRVIHLIEDFRSRGHLVADLDPLQRGRGPLPGTPFASSLLQLLSERTSGSQGESHVAKSMGLHNTSKFHRFYIGNATLAPPSHSSDAGWTTVDDLVQRLQSIYCSHNAWEYSHLSSREQRQWLQDRIEEGWGGGQEGGSGGGPSEGKASMLSPEDKRGILKRLITAETMEDFLAGSFPATKRFGLEGCEALLPGMQALVERAAQRGVHGIELGMAHRGRLNVLCNLLGKDPALMFAEMDARQSAFHVGDVKYHLGTKSSFKVPAPGDALAPAELRLDLSPNPSHLEAVNAVVLGQVKARQAMLDCPERASERVMGVLMHGDAAFSGLGSSVEVMQLSLVPGYDTGGTIHIVMNNQIGFTTDPEQARSTPHCTDIATGVKVPVFHANADHPEAVVRVCQLAVDYRQLFKSDVVIDLVGYRRNGHNELDDATQTQPELYRRISAHPTCGTQYASQLVREGVVTEDEVCTWNAEQIEKWQTALSTRTEKMDTAVDWLTSTWQHQAISRPSFGRQASPKVAPKNQVSGLSIPVLQELGRAVTEVTAGFTAHPHVRKVLQARRGMLEGPDSRVDWAFAEQLAFASLLTQHSPPINVRLSGQDCERGTFNQRHAVLHDSATGALHTPLRHLRHCGGGPAGQFAVLNSPLSEAAVLGFEYGYSLATQEAALTLWEAQFGDFANNAQVIIDQFIASAEDKWDLKTRLVLLLPHGYDGQGPDHSSARMERFLQLCNDDPDTLPGTSQHTRQVIRKGFLALDHDRDGYISRDEVYEYLRQNQSGHGASEEAGAEQMEVMVREMSVDSSQRINLQDWEAFMVQYLRRNSERLTNIHVANVSTPAQYFHLLRQQMMKPYGKPLVVLAPKYLLHHRPCTSALKDFCAPRFFTRVIDDGKFTDNTRHLAHHPTTGEPYLLDADRIKRAIICTGQVYYKMSQMRRARKIKDVVLIRLELIAPFPHDLVIRILNRYPNAEVVWCQEEPKNMGAWLYVGPRLQTALKNCDGELAARKVRYNGRPASASTATASPYIHAEENKALIESALMLRPIEA